MKTKFVPVVPGFLSAIFAASALAQTPTTTYTYDLGSRLNTMTESNGQAHSFQHNAFNEMVLHRQPNPAGLGVLGEVAYGYNGQGFLSQVTDPRGLSTTYHLDGLGNTTTLTSPDTGVSDALYDEAGNRTSYSDARGVTVRSTYDALNRLTGNDYGDQVVTFGYDAGVSAGQLSSMSDGSGSTTWTHDKLGRVLTKTQVTGGGTLAVAYTYLAGGRVATMTYPSGVVVGFTYDGANVASISVNGVPVVTGIAYLPFGGPKSWVMGAIGTYTRSVDTNGRITSHTSEFGLRTLTWDASSRLTAITEPGRPPRGYGYDNLNRLTTANEQPVGTFAFDLTGNRTGVASNGMPYSYGVDNGSNRLQHSSGSSHMHTYSYDAAGNITSDGSRMVTYDGAGRLTSLAGAGGQAHYSYNGLGQRVLKTTSDGPRYFIYAEDGVSLLGEYAAGGPVHETVYLAGMPVLVLKGGAAYFVLPDHLGTPRTVKSATGETVWRWTSDAYGNGAAEDNPSGLFQFTFNQRFPGQQFDAESGLHYNNARFYDPKTGRYVTSDPIGLAGGLNTFAYVNSNSVGMVDPTGRYAVVDDLVFSIGGALVGLIGQGVSDYAADSRSGWKDYLGSAIGGAAGGEALLYSGPVMAGIVSGFVTNLTKQTLKIASNDQCGLNPKSLIVDTAIGAVTGSSRIPGGSFSGVNVGRGNWNSIFKQMTTKFQKNQISNIKLRTALKMGGGRAVETALIPGMAVGAFGGTYVSPYIPGYTQ